MIQEGPPRSPVSVIGYGTTYPTPCQRRHFQFWSLPGHRFLPILSQSFSKHGPTQLWRVFKNISVATSEFTSHFGIVATTCVREMTPSTDNRGDTRILVRPRWTYKDAGGASTGLTPTGTDYPPSPAMKITLSLVLVSLSAVTIAKPGFVRERKHQHHHNQCATRNNTTHPGSTTHPAATHPVTTPNPGTTPNSEANPYQGTTTHSVSRANSASYTSSATNPAATTPSSGGWVQNPSGKASFTAYSGCQAACESSTIVKVTRSSRITSSSSLRSESEWVLRRGK